MKIEVRDLIRKFGAYTALNRVSLDADDGELVAAEDEGARVGGAVHHVRQEQAAEEHHLGHEIGRASCRERV